MVQTKTQSRSDRLLRQELSTQQSHNNQKTLGQTRNSHSSLYSNNFNSKPYQQQMNYSEKDKDKINQGKNTNEMGFYQNKNQK
ncbi:hypothetical protein BB558_002653 [Smittium angustum]|uniref:Uncharacterized protein n=1 Tax=Smittium angustum TaxID=133377 RepID=A0A2U1IW09_SMIAN|nr:hypothetical protein BB558_007082 [Smittium angustum]PWA01258.1 hypothetical protein BB558_002653 [Smittium angustum]